MGRCYSSAERNLVLLRGTTELLTAPTVLLQCCWVLLRCCRALLSALTVLLNAAVIQIKQDRQLNAKSTIQTRKQWVRWPPPPAVTIAKLWSVRRSIRRSDPSNRSQEWWTETHIVINTQPRWCIVVLRAYYWQVCRKEGWVQTTFRIAFRKQKERDRSRTWEEESENKHEDRSWSWVPLISS